MRAGAAGPKALDGVLRPFLAGAPIGISGFSLDEIDQIVIGDEQEVAEQGPLQPGPGGVAIAHLGDLFELAPHRLICGDATDPMALGRLTDGDPPTRLVLTDEPYSVPIAGHVSGGDHRKFAMTSGDMTDPEFLGFNIAWIEALEGMQTRPAPILARIFKTFIGPPRQFAI